MTNGIDLALRKLPATKIEPAILKASLGSYETWARWAEQYLDSNNADNKQLSQELASCASGIDQACLGAGNHSALRGNQQRARQLLKPAATYTIRTLAFLLVEWKGQETSSEVAAQANQR